MSVVDRMSSLYILVKHNTATHEVRLVPEATIATLSDELQRLTGIPVSGQKLICCGKKLPTEQPDLGLVEGCGFRPGVGTKLMLLGKKYDPEGETCYKDIIAVETKAANLELKINEVKLELEDISKGHLDPSHHKEAFKGILKRVKGANEELQRLLETLDSITLTEEQKESKVKRKSVASKINKVMDMNDVNLDKVNYLVDHGL